MVVVSDTSAISNLWGIGELDLLKKVFHTIIIPSTVHLELLQYSSLSHFELNDYPWIQVRRTDNLNAVKDLLLHLDPGEAEAIILAEEVQADLIIIDESKGRKIAKERGLNLTGLLGVLLEAKYLGIIPEIKSLLDRLLDEVNFRVHPNLYKKVLDEAGEGE